MNSQLVHAAERALKFLYAFIGHESPKQMSMIASSASAISVISLGGILQVRRGRTPSAICYGKTVNVIG